MHFVSIPQLHITKKNPKILVTKHQHGIPETNVNSKFTLTLTYKLEQYYGGI